jgi:nitrate reductase gamma subunit
VSGIIWHIFTFGAVGIFLIVIVYRTVAINKLPLHLRWELAPIPHEKEKSRYGGSYLEEYEWWRKPRKKSRVAPIIFIAGEILLMKGVWKHNRTLWPFSFSFHTGIYLLVVTLFLHVINAIFIITGVPLSVLNVFLEIDSIFAVVGYIIGSLGTIGLIFKRVIDSNLRPFNTFSTYFRLVFLGAVFISGGYAWFYHSDYASKMSIFIKKIITLEAGITVTLPMALHISLFLLFLVYFPLTDMLHFIAKYFTYHVVRWNDEPQDEKMTKKLRGLMTQRVGWSARHVQADSKKSWAEITSEKMSHEEKP